MSALVRTFLRERSAAVGLALIVLIALAAAFGPLIDPHSPNAVNHALLGHPLPPSLAHPLGTDLLGRDELARALVGARVSLTIGITAMLVGVLVGTLYGGIAGAAGGAIDNVMMRFVDALLSFPIFFLIITIEALTNSFSLPLIVLVIGLTSWMGIARLVRAEVLSLRERDFAEAARAIGASPWRVLARHLLPNALSPVFVAGTLAVGDNILVEAGLSYLGLGVQVPTASWGNMLQDALLPTVRSAVWLIVTPGLLIVITLLAFSLTGEGLRVAFERMGSARETAGVADEPPARTPSPNPTPGPVAGAAIGRAIEASDDAA